MYSVALVFTTNCKIIDQIILQNNENLSFGVEGRPLVKEKAGINWSIHHVCYTQRNERQPQGSLCYGCLYATQVSLKYTAKYMLL